MRKLSDYCPDCDMLWEYCDCHSEDCTCENCLAWDEEYDWLMEPYHYYEY